MTDHDQIHDDIASRLAEPQAVPSSEDDSTLQNLRSELETLADAVRVPVVADTIDAESDLREGLEFVKQIGRELTHLPAESAAGAEAEVQTIREYRILEKLGQGGMGTVYKAVHTKLNRAVALKVLPSDKLNSSAAVERFEREMAAVGSLSHPNIVAASDAGEADGTHYLVMELVDGYDLSALQKRVPQLKVSDACEIIRQAAEGLAHAHQRSIIHRDIKPSNIMLARQESGPPIMKILDLGLALLDETGTSDTPEKALTSTGQMMGTFDYMAPEQGTDSHTVDERADIYSLGATLYRLLTGEAPFDSRRYSTAFKLLTAKTTVAATSVAELRTDVSAELSQLVADMLALDPEDRPTSAAEIIERLAPFAQGAALPELLTLADESENTAVVDIRTTIIASAEEATDAHRETVSDVAGGRRSGSGSTRRWLWGSFAAGLLGLVAYGIMLTFSTKQGTVYIEANGLEIAEVLLDGKHGAKLKSRADGKGYEFTVDEQTAELTLKTSDGTTLKTSLGTEKLTVRTGRGQTIMAWLEPESKASPITAGKSDLGSLVKWIQANGGEIRLADGAKGDLVNGPEDVDGWAGRFNVSFAQCTNFSDADLRTLCELWPSARSGSLILDGTRITSPGLRAISGRPISVLSLRNTAVDDRVAETLKSLRSLEYLDLDDTLITGECFSSLASLRRLSELIVRTKHLLGEYLPQLRGSSVAVLRIGPSGARPSDFQFLAQLPNLREVDLKESRDAFIASGRKHSFVNDALLEIIAEARKLDDVSLWNTITSDDGLRYLATLPHLESLRTRCTHITDEGLRLLSKSHPRLTVLELHESLVTDDGLSTLHRFQNLQRVGLNGNRNITSRGLATISQLHSLAICALSDTAVVDSDVEKLAQLPNLRELALKDTEITDKALQHLSQARNLRLLEVEKASVTAAGIARLQNVLPQCVIHSIVPQHDIAAAFTDIRFAGWVRDHGGKVELTVAANDPADILSHPTGNLVVDFTDCKDFGDEDVQELVALVPRHRDSINLNLRATSVTDIGVRKLQDVRIYHLDLEETGVTDDTLPAIAAIPRLHVLILNRTKVTGFGLKHLAGCTNLFRLELEELPLANDDLVHLKRMPLKTLTLRAARVGDAGMKHILDLSRLQKLELSTPVTEAGVGAVVTALPNIEQIYLFGMPTECVAEVARLKKCRLLSLTDTHVTEDSLARIAGMASLRKLDLNYYRVRPEISRKGLSALTNSETLDDIFLSNISLADSDFEALKKLRRLKHLSLRSMSVTDEIVPHLTSCANLRTLSLSQTQLTSKGVARLRTEMPQCDIESDISDDQITAAMGSADHDIRFTKWVIGRGGKLTSTQTDASITIENVTRIKRGVSIDFSGLPDVTDADLKKLAALWPRHRPAFNLNLERTAVTDTGVASLRGLPIHYLNLNHTRVTNAALESVSQNARLTRLTLIDTRVTGAGLSHLSHHENLSELDLEELEIGDGNLVHLRNLPLRRLALRESSVSDDGLRDILNIKSLRVLELSDPITSDGVADVVEALPSLTEIHLHGAMNDAAIAEVSKLQSCEVVGLHQVDCTDAAFAQLAKMPRLRKLNFDMNSSKPNAISRDGLAALCACPDLQELYLTGIRLKDHDYKVFTEYPSLSFLKIRFTPVSVAGLMQLANCQTLKKLQLERTGVTPAGVAAFRKALPQCEIETDAGN